MPARAPAEARSKGVVKLNSRWKLLTGLFSFAAVVAFAFVPQVVGGSTSVAPSTTNMLDCNGWSNVYKSTKPNMRGLCTDPFAEINGKPTRFYDNERRRQWE
jgi:hypothetical protein